MRGTMGRGVITPLKHLGFTVECYWIVNPKLSLEYIVYFPKEHADKVRMNIRSPFASNPIRRYMASDPAHKGFLPLQMKYDIKSEDYAGFYAYISDFEDWVEPITPPVLQGDSL